MNPYTYFERQDIINKRKYDALRDFFFLHQKAEDVASKYSYTLSAFYSLTRDFRKALKQNTDSDIFFKEVDYGRPKTNLPILDDMIIGLRKNNYSAEDIVGMVNSQGYNVTYGYVYSLLKKEGFGRLIRRSKQEKRDLEIPKIKASKAVQLDFKEENFYSSSTGIFIFLPLIKQYGIDKIIASSAYPETIMINRVSSILSFVALKLSNVKRYSNDDRWCMDRGLGLFAGLNVLPKSAWLSSYSSRVTKDMNMEFLRALHQIWVDNDLLSQTSNLDFTTIPYWGEDLHLENNWSGKRNKALSSMLAVLAQDPDSGIIDYGSCDVMHKNESAVVLEYLDFYSVAPNNNLRYLVFDSKFTNYQNLSLLDDKSIKFITIRRRGKNIIDSINENKKAFKTIRVSSGMKKRTLKTIDEVITLRGYYDFNSNKPKQIRQVTITGNGKIKPALIITNDFEIKTEQIVRKYARRWLIEKGISEQIDFFHLNRVSSSMVIKVDFDLTMTLFAHNLYRLLAKELERYSKFTSEKLFNKFIENNGNISISNNYINVELKKKRDLPLILEFLNRYDDLKLDHLYNFILNFIPSSSS